MKSKRLRRRKKSPVTFVTPCSLQQKALARHARLIPHLFSLNCLVLQNYLKYTPYPLVPVTVEAEGRPSVRFARALSRSAAPQQNGTGRGSLR